MPRTLRDQYPGTNIEMLIKTFYELRPELKNMLVCRCPTGSTNFFLVLIHENIFLVTNILPSNTYPGEQRRLLFLSSASFFSCSCCFDFFYPLSPVENSPGCAILVPPNKLMESN